MLSPDYVALMMLATALVVHLAGFLLRRRFSRQVNELIEELRAKTLEHDRTRRQLLATRLMASESLMALGLRPSDEVHNGRVYDALARLAALKVKERTWEELMKEGRAIEVRMRAEGKS